MTDTDGALKIAKALDYMVHNGYFYHSLHESAVTSAVNAMCDDGYTALIAQTVMASVRMHWLRNLPQSTEFLILVDRLPVVAKALEQSRVDTQDPTAHPRMQRCVGWWNAFLNDDLPMVETFSTLVDKCPDPAIRKSDYVQLLVFAEILYDELHSKTATAAITTIQKI
jgi:hypothetical protein